MHRRRATVGPSRRGFSIIELMATVAVGSTIAGLAVAMLYMLISVDRASRDDLRRQRTAERLAADFRDDAHAALDAVQVDRPAADGPPATAWRFQLAPERSVQYRLIDGSLDRTRWAGDRRVSRETYELPKGAKVSIAVDRTGTTPFASLRIEPTDEPGPRGPSRPIRVDGVLGFDHRFNRLEETR